jgi:prolyl-tRNA synthetase
VPEKSIEVGNIFSLGKKFSEPLGLNYIDEKGEKKDVVMGSYGIGSGRLIGTVVETLSDEKGIVWPKEISPFAVHLVEINSKKNEAVKSEAEKIYNKLESSGVEVLWDDRELTAGEKFVDSDLIGIPLRIIISEKTLAENLVEVKNRATGEIKKVKSDNFINELMFES